MDYKAQFENGQLDRIAGLAIMTREQHKAANPGVGSEDLEDLYHAYRNGFICRNEAAKVGMK